MSLPANWATMSSTSAIGTKEVVVSGFTFHVLSFGTNVNQLISSGVDSEKINISYRIIDKTDYGATVNPKTTYGSGIWIGTLQCVETTRLRFLLLLLYLPAYIVLVHG